MANAIARICVHESSRPIPNLLVTWYATPEATVPETVQDPTNWEALRMANWKGFNVIRVGSASTNEDGIAQLSYVIDRAEEVASRSPNLWYTIQLPEVVGTSMCGRVIHASCQITVNASEDEEFAIRIPQNLIERYQIDRNVSPIIDSKRSSVDFDVALEKIEHGFIETLSPETIPFSTQFNEEVVKAKENREKEFGRTFAPMSFSLPVDLKNADSSGESCPEIVFDTRKKQLCVKSGQNNSKTPLTFGGVVRYTNQEIIKKDIKNPHILVDEATGQVTLALPKVPDTLELSETAPTRLSKRSNAELE